MNKIPPVETPRVDSPISQNARESEPIEVRQEPGARSAPGSSSAPDRYGKAEAQPSPSAQAPLRGPATVPSAVWSFNNQPPTMPVALAYEVPKNRPLDRSDFQHAQVRHAVARALAQGSAAFGLQPVALDEQPVVIPDVRFRARNVAAHQEASGGAPRLVIDAAQLEATLDFLSKGIQEAAGGLKAKVTFNGYPAAFSFADDGTLNSDLDMGSELNWHEWFAPMARLGYTAGLSHDPLYDMAQAYKKALLKDERAILSAADSRGLALYEYALNILYIFYHVDLSYQKPDGTPMPEPEAKAYLANAQHVINRARENQQRLKGMVPQLDLPDVDAARL